ncbi:MAG: cation:dicarboxylase symporter family transporter [Chitinophagaceae bacterium]|nr:cation:dicarboxylase symporter family transporter [Chitinophagaceae bacterium]
MPPHKQSKPFYLHLTFWVLLAIIVAILLGHFFPATAVKTEWMGKRFVDLIKLFIGPIIFLTIVLGITGMGNLKKAGRIGLKAVIYFEIVTTFALVLGIVFANIFQPGKIHKEGLPVSVSSPPTSAEFSWISFLKENFTLQVLIIAIITGVALSLTSYREKVTPFLARITHYVFIALKYVMYLAPLGAFGGMAYTVGRFGIKTLIPLGKLMLTMYGTMAVFIFIVLGTILRYYKLNIFKFLGAIKEELLIVLGTSSSESALPSLMKKLESMGCSKPVVGLVVPTGYSFNLDGTSIYLSMAIIFLAQLYNVHLSWMEMLSIIGILMVTSKGAAGVTGSGFIILASTLTALHRIPLEGLAFLLAVDKFMSEARAITNIIGNGVATLAISKSEKEFVHPLAAQ